MFKKAIVRVYLLGIKSPHRCSFLLSQAECVSKMSKLHFSIPCVLLGYPYRTIVFLREINGYKIAPLYSFSNLKLIEWGGTMVMVAIWALGRLRQHYFGPTWTRVRPSLKTAKINK